MMRTTFGILALAALGACASGPPPPLVVPGLETGTIRFVNNDTRPIVNIRIASCEAGFLPDRLVPGEVVAPGASRDFTVSPGCYNSSTQAGQVLLTSAIRVQDETIVKSGETVVFDIR